MSLEDMGTYVIDMCNHVFDTSTHVIDIGTHELDMSTCLNKMGAHVKHISVHVTLLADSGQLTTPAKSSPSQPLRLECKEPPSEWPNKTRRTRTGSSHLRRAPGTYCTPRDS